MNIRSLLVFIAALSPVTLPAQIGVPARPLPNEPFVIDTAEQGPVRVSVTKGLVLPWDLAFLPNGDLLVTERTAGRLRIIRNGALDPAPISGLPEIGGGAGGLMSVVVHPRFADNGLVYLSYTKNAERGRRAVGLARGRLDGNTLTDVRELFTADEPGGGPPPGLPLVFGPDAYLYFGIGGANDEIAQRGDSYYGKVLRLNDDGSVPANPFAGRDGFHPELYTIGHRNMIGMTVHPTTGAIWQNENGPLGGDEVNILKPGANYGWPLVSYGRDYSGAPVSAARTMDGVEDPVLFWNPSIAISGMTLYTGDAFPSWRNNLFVGGLQFGRIPRTGQMHRIVFNDDWQEIRREALFVELRQRIRDVEQGPDGLLYVLTDEQDGALLKLEPVAARTAIDLEFIPSTPAHGYAARAYQAIWDEHGERIVAALEAHSCLAFQESTVAAVIDDAVSHSGGPEHPMRLRASYPVDVKQSTLVHELGHRHLWQLEERLDDVDGHKTLFLILDRVWADVWGESFAADRIRGESEWQRSYDYADAWDWAQSLAADERLQLWNGLLTLNGFPSGCNG